MSKGVLYVADAGRVSEAVRSAASVKRAMSEISIAIATDASSVPEPFDRVVSVSMDEWDWDTRIEMFTATPFDRTLYLDTDTYVTADVSDLFELLDEYEIAAAHAPVRRAETVMDTGMSAGDHPEAFVEFNCGVLGFRTSDDVLDLFDRWKERFRAYRRNSAEVHDQPAFRDVVYSSSVDIATLPPEYNLRLPFSGFVSDPVKIVHGNADNLQYVADRLNSRTGPRTFTCVSLGETWDVVFHSNPVQTTYAKAKILVRNPSLVLRKLPFTTEPGE